MEKQFQDPHELATELDQRFKDHLCVVTLEHGRDHIGKARMEIEEIYYDEDVDRSRVVRIVGRQTEGSDHAMFGLPIEAGPVRMDLSEADDRCSVEQGHLKLVILPSPVDRQGLDDRPV